MSIYKKYFFYSALLISAIFFSVFSYSDQTDNLTNAYKLYAFSLCIGLLLMITGCLLILNLRDYRYMPAWNFIDMLVIFFFVYILTNTLILGAPSGSEKLLSWLLCGATYISIRCLAVKIGDTPTWIFFMYGITVVCILQLLIGMLQFYGLLSSLNNEFSITGTFKNPAPFALLTAACFPLSLSIHLFFRGKKFKALRRISLVNIVLSLIVLPLTGIRAAWMAVTITSLMILVHRYKLRKKILVFTNGSGLRKCIIAASACLCIAISCIGLYRIKSLSADSRLVVWQNSVDRFLQAPLFGSGFGAFKGHYGKWQVNAFEKNPQLLNKRYASGTPVSNFAGYVRTAFNEYLEIAVELGIAGLLAFLFLITTFFRRSILHLKRRPSLLLLTSLAGLSSILIEAMTSYPFYSLPTLALFFILLAFGNSFIRKTSSWHPAFHHHRYFYFLLIGFFITASLQVFQLGASRIKYYMNYAEARIECKQDNFESSLASYDRLYQHLNGDPIFLLDYAVCLLGNRSPDRAYRMLVAASHIDSDPRLYLLMGNICKDRKDYNKAEYMYNFAHLLLPSRIYPKYLTVLLYQEKKDTAAIISLAKDILTTPGKGDDDMGKSIKREMENLLKKYKAPYYNSFLFRIFK